MPTKKRTTKQNEYSIICAILNKWILKKELEKTKKMGPTPAS
jgi:hypothetical protein